MLEMLKETDVNTRDESGLTALHWSCRIGNTEIAKLLLKRTRGIKINAQDNSGWTPLHYAAMANHEEIVTMLLQCPSIDVNVKNVMKQKPMHLTTSKSIAALLSYAAKKQKVASSKSINYILKYCRLTLFTPFRKFSINSSYCKSPFWSDTTLNEHNFNSDQRRWNYFFRTQESNYQFRANE